MPLIVISQAAFDEVAKAIRETVTADAHDAYFTGPDAIDMDRVVLTTHAGAASVGMARGHDDGSGYCEDGLIADGLILAM